MSISSPSRNASVQAGQFSLDDGMHLLQRNVVKVHNRDAKPNALSAGFLSYNGKIFTCAHAIDRKRGSHQQADDIVIYFDGADGLPYEVTVKICLWDADIAILELAKPEAVESIVPLPLADFRPFPQGYGSGAFQIRGYPAGFEEKGLTTDLSIAASFREDGASLLSTGPTEEGFSGSPVWDNTRQCVVGMVIERFHTQHGMQGGIAVSASELRKHAGFESEFKTNPYKFLEFFGANQDDAELYFGRNNEIEDLAFKLGSARVILVTGPSGAGKSSFIRAGLYAALGLTRKGTDRPLTPLLVFTAGGSPFFNLVSELVAGFPETLGPELKAHSAEELRARSDTLAASPEEMAEILIKTIGSTGVIAFDQYERMWTECKDPALREAMLQVIEISSKKGLRWVVAVRDDFPLIIKAIMQSLFPIPIDLKPLGRRELRETIVKPAERKHRGFEQAAVDLLLDAVVNRPAALPLLQFSLSKLWEAGGKEGLIAESMLMEIGFDKKRAELKEILGTYAQGICMTLKEKERDAAPHLLAKFACVTRAPLEDKAGIDIAFTSRSVAVSELDETSLSIAETLAKSHLLLSSAERGGEGRAFSLAHEVLLGVWDDLRKACLAFERGISYYAGDFSQYLRLYQLSKGRHAALLPEEILVEAEQLRKVPQLERMFEGDSLRLVLASRKALDKEAEDKRRGQRVKIGVISGVAALVAIGAIAFAIRTRRDEIKSHSIALKNRGTLALADRDFPDAEIYFAKALSLSETQSTRESLLQARSAGISAGARSMGGNRGASGVAAVSPEGTVVAEALGGRSIRVRSVSGTGPGITVVAQAEVDMLWISPAVTHIRYLVVSANSEVGAFSIQVFRIYGDGRAEILPLDQGGKYPSSINWKRRVSQVSFDIAHDRFLVASEDASLKLFSVRETQAHLDWGKEGAHAIAVHGVAFNSDGSLAATAGADYAVRIWDMKNSDREPMTLWGHQDAVFAVAFSPGDSLLASGGYDRAIRLWDVKSAIKRWRTPAETPGRTVPNPPEPRTTRIFQGHGGVVLDLRFSEDGSMLASVGKDGSARIWDADRSRQVLTLMPHNGRLRSVSFPGYGKDILIAGDEGWSQWHTSGRLEAGKVWMGGPPVGTLTFTRDSRYLVIGSGSASGDLARAKTDSAAQTLTPMGKIGCLEEGNCGINGLATSPDGKWLAAGGQGRLVNLWDISGADWKPTQAALEHPGPVWGLAFDRTGNVLATSSAAGSDPSQSPTVSLWSVPSWKSQGRISTPFSNYAIAQCGKEGDWMVGDAGGRVHAFDAHLREHGAIANVARGETNVWGLACFDALGLVFSANSDGRVRAWDGNAPNSLLQTSEQEGRVNPTLNTVAVNASRCQVAASGDGDRVQVYNVPCRTVPRSPYELPIAASYFGQEGTVWMAAYSADGDHLAYGGLDGFVKLIHLKEANATAARAGAAILEESERLTGLRVDDKDEVVPLAIAGSGKEE